MIKQIVLIIFFVFAIAWVHAQANITSTMSHTPAETEETLNFKIQLYQLPEGWQLLCVYFKAQMQSPLCIRLHQAWYRPHKITINGLVPK